MTFPIGFAWGAATASYQIEGAAREDGKGLSIWDVFSSDPGRVAHDETGDVACDHYHRYAEDVALMAEIGLQAYRFSISWPRVMPDGTGRANERGLAFYDRLVDALLARGIAPWVTLYHWDLPHALSLRGGWLNRESADWFADYTALVVDRLSDRVSHWMPFNEPQVFVGMGYQHGQHAPGLKLAFPDVWRAAHHVLLAHGRAVAVIRARARSPARVGTAMVANFSLPATTDERDVEAAKRASFATPPLTVRTNASFGHPMILGRYPDDMVRHNRSALDAFVRDGDLASIAQSLDFFGVNIYGGRLVRAGADGNAEAVAESSGAPRNALGWPIRPEAMYWGPRFLHECYGLPIVITENGMPNLDWVQADGQVRDPQRIDFTAAYLRELHRAHRDGIPIAGYFHWSLLDNFEWAHGYTPRFGLIHVDYRTGARTPKASARWYADVIRSGGTSLWETMRD